MKLTAKNKQALAEKFSKLSVAEMEFHLSALNAARTVKLQTLHDLYAPVFLAGKKTGKHALHVGFDPVSGEVIATTTDSAAKWPTGSVLVFEVNLTKAEKLTKKQDAAMAALDRDLRGVSDTTTATKKAKK